MQQALDFIGKYITLNNITFVLALIGSIGTAWTVVQSRRNIKLRIIKYGAKEDKILIYLMIQNKSRLPISLSKISLKLNGTYYSCAEMPIMLDRHTYYSGNTITGYAHYYNMNIPVNLSGLAGTSGYILFELPKGTDIPEATHLTFQVSSNRGSAIEMKCPIPQSPNR